MFREKHWKTHKLYSSNRKIVYKNWSQRGRNYKNIYYILQVIDSERIMVSSLSNHVNNLSEGIHKIKCKFEHDDKKCETCRIEYIAIVFLNTQILKIIL